MTFTFENAVAKLNRINKKLGVEKVDKATQTEIIQTRDVGTQTDNIVKKENKKIELETREIYEFETFIEINPIVSFINH